MNVLLFCYLLDTRYLNLTESLSASHHLHYTFHPRWFATILIPMMSSYNADNSYKALVSKVCSRIFLCVNLTIVFMV